MKKQFDKVVERRGTYCTQWDYIEDRFGEKNILPFSISDMDFQTPVEIRNRIKEWTDHGVFGYTRWNNSDYKNAIVTWYKKRHDADIVSEWIIYSPSVIYSISQLIALLTRKNDAIVMQTPAYDAFFKTIKQSERKLIKNPLLYEDGYYKIDWIDLEKKLAKSESKVFLLCNPHNPTGRVWRREEIIKIVKLCDCYGVKVISDDIHMDIIYRENKYIPIINVASELNNVFICTSGSKTFNTPSLGGSYVIIPDHKVRSKYLSLMKDRDGLGSAPIFGMVALIEGYNYAEYWVDELRKYLYQNMEIVYDYLKKELPLLHFSIPESTYLAWIDASKLNASNKKIQDYLVHVGKVGIMSGEVYGETEKFLRMNIGCPKEKLYDGLEKLKFSVNHMLNA
ncbi:MULTISPECIES: MalY/PatB family protein [unclassified Virgibacillus]|uniref:MalY/PatB family protein n=1 Tax=unclassified Virgibacillus TaxID=2620237 RepID=UPI00090BE440|nr:MULTISPECIES: MalY/PatB family protein [unclassified Virgibacillus]API93010.1 beta-cystathionase [Virgibacillus sp. 6R]MBS7428539.1 pyridoxal phosphate-dependent aminotransferase [Virgibacillus sp. 19R1-5]